MRTIRRLLLSFGMCALAGMTPWSVCAQEPGPVASFDLSLSEAFERADKGNPQLLTAQNNLNLAQADVTVAGAVPNPQISFAYGFGAVYYENGNPQQSYGLSQNFELGGKRNARLTLAGSQYQLATLQLNALRRDIRDQVRRAYAELAAAEALSQAVDVQIGLLDRLVFVVRRRFEAGATSEAELLQAKLARTQVDPARITTLNRIKRARIQLNSLLGDTPEQPNDVRDNGLFKLSVTKTELVPGVDAVLPSVQNFLERAFKTRLDLQVALQQGEIGRSQLGLAQALRVPDLQLSAGYQRYTGDGPQTDGVSLGLAVTLPIFYNQNGELARAQAAIRQSDLLSRAVRAQIEAEVRTAYQDLLAARESILKYKQELLPSSEDVLGLSRRSYEVGKTGLSSVILSQQADQQVRTGYIDAVVAYQSAFADLERAVGGPIAL